MERIKVGPNNVSYPTDVYIAVPSEISDEDAKQLIRQALAERGCGLPDDVWDAIDDFKPFVRLGIITTEVEYEDIHDPHERIARIFLKIDEYKHPWLMPADVLEKIDAAFPLAKLQCLVYACFPTFVWFISYVGPPIEKLLEDTESAISDEDVEELDRLFGIPKNSLV